MQFRKRALIWLTLAALFVSLLPAGWVQRTNAAGAATYFIPDITELRNTALLTTDNSGTIISRDNVYLTNQGTLTITGTFAYVTKETMSVKVEQLNASSDGTWVADDTHFTTAPVVAESGSSNRFVANNLTLFPGFNRITFTGLQGTVERSDTFYVLYDRVPYLQSLKIAGGTSTPIVLNEGSQVAVQSETITLQGVAKNVTKVTVGVNGRAPVLTSLLEDGTFFTPALQLSPGLNTLSLSLQNGSDSVNFTRFVYYFNPDNPFTKLDFTVTDGSTSATYPLLDNVPTITESATSGDLTVQLLLAYSDDPFGNAGNATFTTKVNGGTPATATVDPTGNNVSEIVFPGSDGVTPKYRLVTFTIPNLAYSSTEGLQTIDLTVTYDPAGPDPQYSISKSMKFQYLPGRVRITNMYYLPAYGGSNKDVSAMTKVPLNGAEVANGDFYVLVQSDKAPDSSDELKGVYLPLGTTNLTIDDVTDATGLASDGTERVYQVKGFSNGQQRVNFFYSGSPESTYTANISYVSKTYIYISNLFDGQSIHINSKTDSNPVLEVKGQYIGFENLGNVQYFVNGLALDQSVPEYKLDADSALKGFTLTLPIKPEGPIVYGENRILFTGTSEDAAGNKRDVSNELRIYIIDDNVSTIDRFQPSLVPTSGNRVDFTAPPFSQEQIAGIFALTPEFIFKDDKYVTSQKTYDLVLRGSGASKLNLNFGSQPLISGFPIPSASDTGSKVGTGTTNTIDGRSYDFDWAGDENDFILRVRNLVFDAPGAHVYTLELINSTGARTSQRLEIDRELSPYRILAPQPTVGNNIVVNKNFVRFDIEAEGATGVLIGGKPATKRTDASDRFVYDYVGLKPGKSTAIKIQINRPTGNISDTVNVFYTDAVQVDSQYMDKLSSKMSIFNKKIQLTFPKGTVLKSAIPTAAGVTKFYPDTQLLFGIADPTDGVVERRNDYGNIINRDPDSRSNGGSTTITIPDYLVIQFNSTVNTDHFTRISPIYWISGGVGEDGDKGSATYAPATNGEPPYFVEGNNVRMFADPVSLPLQRKVVPSNRGTLTLSYDDNVVEDVSYTVTVFRYTDKGVWENIGGEVDTKNHTISVPFDEFGYYKVMKLKYGYPDITNHPWARNILNGLYSKGIMNNLRFDEFGADDQTTRGEFATLLVKGLNIPLDYDDNQSFSDVVPGARSATWDYEHIETAARAGIVTGLSDGFFGADMRITREEAATMIARALELKLAVNDDKLLNSLAKSYADSGSIQYYARPAVDAVTKAGIMSGSPYTVAGQTKPLFNFNPKANLTRAEAGKIAVKLLQKSTKIFPKNLS